MWRRSLLVKVFLSIILLTSFVANNKWKETNATGKKGAINQIIWERGVSESI